MPCYAAGAGMKRNRGLLLVGVEEVHGLVLAAHRHGAPVARVPGLLVLVVALQRLRYSLRRGIMPSMGRGAGRDDHAAVAQGRERNGQAVHGLTQA